VRIQTPWLNLEFIDERGERKEMGKYTAAPGFGYKASVENAHSADSNILGTTLETVDRCAVPKPIGTLTARSA
jgi:argininosuccinate synthase